MAEQGYTRGTSIFNTNEYGRHFAGNRAEERKALEPPRMPK